jgi:hypothetical protein
MPPSRRGSIPRRGGGFDGAKEKEEKMGHKNRTIPPFVGAGANLTQMRRSAAFEKIQDENCIEMKFPKELLVTVDAHQRRIFFAAGVNGVPKFLANWRQSGQAHPTLIAAGVTKV